jgi:hypothetical protein
MRANPVDDQHPQREEDTGAQLGNFQNVLKTGQEPLKHWE